MKIKKILLIILFSFVIILVGCGSNNTPEDLWDRYIKAMNEKDIEKVAEIYFEKDSQNYADFIETRDKSEYFGFENLQTKSFTTIVDNDRYYQAEVVLVVDETNENRLDIYFVKDLTSTWTFISEVNVIAEDVPLGNLPDTGFYNTIVKNGEGFYYKYIYGGTVGEPSSADTIKIVHPNSNDKIINIPDSIEGADVTSIGDYAFFKYFSIFSTSYPNSKLEEITLPSNLKDIQQFAFYQTKNLKSIEFPSSLLEVRKYAFASSGLEKIIINFDDEATYNNLAPVEGQDRLTIKGEKVVYIGETPLKTFTVPGIDISQITWSVGNRLLAAIDSIGTLTPSRVGTVEIRAELKSDPSIYATAMVEIKANEEKSQISTPPTNPEMKDFVFEINNTFYTTEEFVPRPIDGKTANWESSNPNVAVVSGNRIKMVGVGQATITASSPADPSVKTSATITVKDIETKYVTTSFSYEGFEVTGGRDMFVGDYITISAPGHDLNEIEWSSDDPEIATIGAYSGLVTALKAGDVKIRGQSIANPHIEVIVSIEVFEAPKGAVFYENSLDRLYDLKEVYINAINPNSIEFRGTLKLPEDVKIYVPAQNIDTYKVKLSRYANNIYPMPED